MQPGTVSIDTMPRLCLLLRAGSEILVGSPSSPQATRSDGKPLMGRANAWIAATARAQRLMETNGSADLFSESHPLTVNIVGARRGGALADAAESGLNWASNALSRGFIALARRLVHFGPISSTDSSISWIAQKSRAAAHSLPWATTEPHALGVRCETSGTDDPVSRMSISSTVNLPARTRSLNDNGILAYASPFWSKEELATNIALHEFGHSAHHLRGADVGSNFGTDLLSPAELNILSALGVYPVEAGQLPGIFAYRLAEGYADCFAALGMGGGSLDATLLACDQTEAYRAALSPARENNYSGMDPLHDTRESCRALRETLVAAGCCPMNAHDVDHLCMRAAQIGTLRWIASISSRPAGSISGLVWARGHQATAELPADAVNAYAASYLTEREKAIDIPYLHELATSLPGPHAPILTKAHSAGCSAALSILNAIHETCGAPRLKNLAGGQASAPELEALGARLKRRSMHDDEAATCGPVRMRHG